MYNKEELEKKNRDEIRKIAKELKIKRWYEKSKCALIDDIVKMNIDDSHLDDVEDKNEEKVNNMVGENESHQNVSEGAVNTATEHKEKYLKDIKPGTIVAFKVNVFGNEKVKSAAVENVSHKRQMLKLKTSYGKEFVVPFSDVIWVRTGSRWPKGVYELLKGVKKNVAEREESK